MIYSYHNRIKQRIRAGELVGYEWREDYPGIGECLVLIFKSEPMFRPIRPHKYYDYVDILAHWNRYNGRRTENERGHDPAPGGAGDPQQPPVVRPNVKGLSGRDGGRADGPPQVPGVREERSVLPWQE